MKSPSPLMKPSFGPAANAAIGKVRLVLTLDKWIRELRAPLWIAAGVAAAYRWVFRVHAYPVAAGVMALGILVWALALRSRPVSKERAAATADQSSHAGGLLLTHLERPLGPWDPELEPALARVKLPKWRWGATATLWNAAGFLALALWMPLPSPVKAHPNLAAVGKLEELKSELTSLEKEGAGDEALKQELAELDKQLAEGRFDGADWEAADTLESRLNDQASEAASRLARAAEAAKALEQAAKNQASAEEMAKAQESLERALAELGDEAQSGQPGASGDKQNPQSGKPQSGKAKPTQGGAEALRKSLEQRQKALAQKFGQKGAGEGSPREGKGEGDPDGEGRRGKSESSPGGKEGNLVFQGEGAEDPSGLDFKPLPPGEGDADQIWSMTSADPKHRDFAASHPVGTLAKGDDAVSHPSGALLPRNRELVRRYFKGASDGE